MKLTNIIGLLIASSSLSFAAPANYNELAPSARALIDATNLICGQYPHREWVLIGDLKVDCVKNAKRDPMAMEEKREDSDTSVDAGWYVEYRVI